MQKKNTKGAEPPARGLRCCYCFFGECAHNRQTKQRTPQPYKERTKDVQGTSFVYMANPSLMSRQAYEGLLGFCWDAWPLRPLGGLLQPLGGCCCDLWGLLQPLDCCCCNLVGLLLHPFRSPEKSPLSTLHDNRRTLWSIASTTKQGGARTKAT